MSTTAAATYTELEQTLPSLHILGVRVHEVSMPQALESLAAMIREGTPHQVVTVNPEFVMAAQQNHLFRNVLNRAALAVPDGIGIVLASWWLRQPMRERVSGVDLVEQFAEVSSRNGYRIFLLGAQPGVAERAGQKLRERHPGLIIAGSHPGSPHPDDEDEICRKILETAPHVLLVAYGSPQQDLWIARTAARLRIPVAIGVGGTFDFIAGITVRAPRWIRSIGMEWFYRLVREPRRFFRMLALPRFLLRVLLSPMRSEPLTQVEQV